MDEDPSHHIQKPNGVLVLSKVPVPVPEKTTWVEADCAAAGSDKDTTMAVPSTSAKTNVARDICFLPLGLGNFSIRKRSGGIRRNADWWPTLAQPIIEVKLKFFSLRYSCGSDRCRNQAIALIERF